MHYHIINTCDVTLWGVTQNTRIKKILARVGDFKYCEDPAQLAPDENLLLLRADYLFEANVIKKLLQSKNTLLLSSTAQKSPSAAWVAARDYLITRDYLLQKQPNLSNEHINVVTPQQLTGGYDPRLRKFDLAHVVEVTHQDHVIIENYLYDKSYKGITDLVTKWWWPLPARWVVRQCAVMKITPNMVTGLGWLLTIICSFAFYFGEFFLGLAAAWIMTFLDTVDGKLARVTLQSSKLGHVLDHGLDIIHPPIWYGCWILGVGVEQIAFLNITFPLLTWIWILLAAYIGGRIFEGLFQLFFNDISIFCWRPIDSYHRLITARRNPCIIMLSISLLIANPEMGFVWVVVWTVLSTSMLACRFLFALTKRIMSGPLESWIETIEPDSGNSSLTVRLFTGYPAIKTIAPLLTEK